VSGREPRLLEPEWRIGDFDKRVEGTVSLDCTVACFVGVRTAGADFEKRVQGTVARTITLLVAALPRNGSLYQVAIKNAPRPRGRADDGVRYGTSRKAMRKQQRCANEGDLVLETIFAQGVFLGHTRN